MVVFARCRHDESLFRRIVDPPSCSLSQHAGWSFFILAGEVGDHVQEHDPTLRLPYHIKEKEGTVGGLSVALGNSYEDWTRALKYMLTDLKWIAAWAAKYLPPC